MNEKEKKAIEYLKTRLYGNEGCKYIDVAQEDLRIFINLVDRLQKENEELKEIYRSEKKMKNEYIKLYQDLLLKENVIPTQNVKDRIEELNRKIDKSIDNSKGGLDEEFIEKAGELLAQKRILQGLLEGRKI